MKSNAIKLGSESVLPGAGLSAGKIPGHWLLARLGKRVLRPGGLELTRYMLESLAIRSSDAVVEFAPGLGVTTRLVLDRHPASYIAIEGDEAAAAQVRCLLAGSNQQCLVGNAAETLLPENSATVVYGEAMLTMQGPAQKHQIVQEAGRLLKPGGRYGVHELCLVPDDLDDSIKQEIQHALSQAIHVGARPLTSREWRAVLKAEGFEVQTEARRPMLLLEANRLIQDEGLWGALRFAWNLCRDQEARQRVFAMRRVFMKYHSHLAAIVLIGVKRLNSTRSNDCTIQELNGRDGASSGG
jgi:ubiquinone/menaquinone biosynthesis C-methylase UbiE